MFVSILYSVYSRSQWKLLYENTKISRAYKLRNFLILNLHYKNGLRARRAKLSPRSMLDGEYIHINFMLVVVYREYTISESRAFDCFSFRCTTHTHTRTHTNNIQKIYYLLIHSVQCTLHTLSSRCILPFIVLSIALFGSEFSSSI